ncbi:MAG: GNAT family N-acetyltransferase [Oscillospiraceae bacterium]|nr:GNAT family N-acetyltransferase [Oscillospiraceae bacterium]MDE5885854.1 GNAT family N-acetyltransferase [Oscillospiraceae bacterium]
MTIREYSTEDCLEITQLFYNTVHSINARDYTVEQLNAWADGSPDLKNWNDSLLRHYSLVAVKNSRIVGFGDMDLQNGYLDRLFTHENFQRQGIASSLCDALESAVSGRITTNASITAKPFFEKRGYVLVQEQQVIRKQVVLINYCMKKII